MTPNAKILSTIKTHYIRGRHPKLITSELMHKDTGIDEAQCSSVLGALTKRGLLKHLGVLDHNRYVYVWADRAAEGDDQEEAREELDHILDQLRRVVIKSLPAKALIEELGVRVENDSSI